MAELQVEPKKKSSLLAWLLLALGIIALIVFLSRRNSDDSGAMGDNNSNAVNAAPPAAADSSAADLRTPASGDEVWSSVNRNAPSLTYGEIHGKNVSVRGTDDYAVYDLGEDVLFDHDKSTIRKDAVSNLKDVAASIEQRFGKGQVRLYGFTDAQGSQQLNMELAKSRAEAVKQWLTSNGNISADRISVEAIGEANPKASNGSEQGRKENRRVQIVAKKAA